MMNGLPDTFAPDPSRGAWRRRQHHALLPSGFGKNFAKPVKIMFSEFQLLGRAAHVNDGMGMRVLAIDMNPKDGPVPGKMLGDHRSELLCGELRG